MHLTGDMDVYVSSSPLKGVVPRWAHPPGFRSVEYLAAVLWAL